MPDPTPRTPPGYRARPATTDDLGPVHRLVAACERGLYGRVQTDPGRVAADFARPGLAPELDTRLIHDVVRAPQGPGVGCGGERSLRHAGRPVHGLRPRRRVVRGAARLPPQQARAVRGHARRDGALQLHEAVAEETGDQDRVIHAPIVRRHLPRSPGILRTAFAG